MPKAKGDRRPICLWTPSPSEEGCWCLPWVETPGQWGTETHFAHRLWDQYFAVMACNVLKVAPLGMSFMKLWSECISIFRTRSRKAAKTTVSTSAIKIQVSKADQLVKSANQLHREKKKENIKAQTKVLEWQKKEIENLKSHKYAPGPKENDRVHDTGHGLYVQYPKGPSQKSTGTKHNGDKLYFRHVWIIWSC